MSRLEQIGGNSRAHGSKTEKADFQRCCHDALRPDTLGCCWWEYVWHKLHPAATIYNLTTLWTLDNEGNNQNKQKTEMVKKTNCGLVAYQPGNRSDLLHQTSTDPGDDMGCITKGTQWYRISDGGYYKDEEAQSVEWRKLLTYRCFTFIPGCSACRYRTVFHRRLCWRKHALTEIKWLLRQTVARRSYTWTPFFHWWRSRRLFRCIVNRFYSFLKCP